MKYDYDVIITGAGPAGCMLAKKLAEGGFRVALLEARKKSSVGYPWEITVEKRIFERIGLRVPDMSIMPEGPDYYRFYAHDRDDYFQIKAGDDAIYYFYHNRFNQYLLDLALQTNIDFLDKHSVHTLLPETGNDGSSQHVFGVEGERSEFFIRRKFRLTGKVIVDASGLNRVLCRQVPEQFMMPKNIRREDIVTAWQEVRKIREDSILDCEKEFSIFPGVAYIRVGKYQAYQIIHYRKNNTINLVFGAAVPGAAIPGAADPGISDDADSAFEEYTVRRPRVPTAEKLRDDFITRYPFFRKQLYGGGRPIILRRSVDSMAGNGFLCLGDAACQVVPTTGSGVTSALYAADIAARTIAKAINTGDYSLNTLWDYNYHYQSKRGAILASYDVLRLFMQNMKPEELRSIFESHLLKDSNFVTIYSSNRIVYNIGQIFENFSAVISNLELVPIGMHIIQAVRDSQKILRHYEHYPEKYSRKNFLKWQKETDMMFARYYHPR